MRVCPTTALYQHQISSVTAYYIHQSTKMSSISSFEKNIIISYSTAEYADAKAAIQAAKDTAFGPCLSLSKPGKATKSYNIALQSMGNL